MAVLRLVTEPPDAPLDPVKELIQTRDMVRRVATNPILPGHCSRAAEAFADLLDWHYSYLDPKGDD